MLRRLRNLFRRAHPRYLWVWELDDMEVSAAVFSDGESERGVCLGFDSLSRLGEEERVEFWIRAAKLLKSELATSTPRRGKIEHIFLFGAGLMRVLGNTFSVRRLGAGRELSNEEIEESLLSLLPQVREALKGRAALSMGLERHEVSVVDGLLEEIRLDGKPISAVTARSTPERTRSVGRELSFKMLLLFVPKTVVREFGALLRVTATREFRLLPRALPLAKLLGRGEHTCGVLVFFSNTSSEISFISSDTLTRNTLVSVGVKTVIDATGSTLGFGGRALGDVFEAWLGQNLSHSASGQLRQLLEPTFVFLQGMFTSAIKDKTSSENENASPLWLLGPGEKIPGLASVLPGSPVLYAGSEAWSALPAISQDLEESRARILPLAAAAWFALTFRETSPWQERFIRALRLLQR